MLTIELSIYHNQLFSGCKYERKRRGKSNTKGEKGGVVEQEMLMVYAIVPENDLVTVCCSSNKGALTHETPRIRLHAIPSSSARSMSDQMFLKALRN